MKKTDVDKLKGMLEQQLRMLQADAGNLNAVAHSAALADVNDQATLESERSFELRIKDRERKLIGKVQDALRKMADGSYGTCESCSEPISVKRLQARPVTTYCINCKAEQEAEEKREEVLAQSSERAL